MKKYIAITALVAVLLSSCEVIGTLYPLSDKENDLVFKKELLGKWGDPKDKSGHLLVDTIAGSAGRLYGLRMTAITEDKKSGASYPDTLYLLGHVVNLGDRFFLDCWYDMKKRWPEYRNEDMADFLIPRHFMYDLSVSSGSVEMYDLLSEEMIKLIEQKKIPLTYASLRKDDYLLLDKTAVLQKVFTELDKYPSLKKDKIILQKLE